VAETADNGCMQPEAALEGPSSRVLAVAVSLAALAVIGAATANSLPDFDRFSLPDFGRISLPNFDHFSLPNFDRFAARPPHEKAAAPTLDPAVSATLKNIEISQQQNAAVLVSLTQSSATQQADLRRISRQLTSLAAQTDALQSAMPPLTTSSIPHSNFRARVFRTHRKTMATLPKPFGPVSVGGAPLSPAPVPDPG
jgi:hypothetical protein